MFVKGQLVRVKNYNEIRQTLDVDDKLKGEEITFVGEMERYCGQTFEVSDVHGTRSIRLKLRGNQWSWHPIWLVPQIIDNRSVN